MTEHTTGTRDEWLAARLKLLEAEKALTRQSDAVAQQRQCPAYPLPPAELLKAPAMTDYLSPTD